MQMNVCGCVCVYLCVFTFVYVRFVFTFVCVCVCMTVRVYVYFCLAVYLYLRLWLSSLNFERAFMLHYGSGCGKVIRLLVMNAMRLCHWLQRYALLFGLFVCVSRSAYFCA
jgi:hypothetical protein